MKKLVQREDGLFQEVDKQVAMIKAIAYRQFRWRRKTLFRKLVEFVPRVKENEGIGAAEKYYSVNFLLDIMSDKDKSYVIKRLLMNEKTNKSRINK